jgi:hypothetical protein
MTFCELSKHILSPSSTDNSYKACVQTSITVIVTSAVTFFAGLNGLDLSSSSVGYGLMPSNTIQHHFCMT